MFISHVESMKAVKSSVYSAAAELLLRGIFGVSARERPLSLEGALLLITEPRFTEKMRMTIADFAQSR